MRAVPVDVEAVADREVLLAAVGRLLQLERVHRDEVVDGRAGASARRSRRRCASASAGEAAPPGASCWYSFEVSTSIVCTVLSLRSWISSLRFGKPRPASPPRSGRRRPRRRARPRAGRSARACRRSTRSTGPAWRAACAAGAVCLDDVGGARSGRRRRRRAARTGRRSVMRR